VEKHKRRNSNS